MSNKVTKISSLSIIVMLVGGTIGAGIFYKNQELLALAQGKFGLVLATWGVGIVGMLALGAALVELTSAQKSDRGTLEWTKLFTPKWFHKASSNFTKWFFIPIMFFAVPIYVTQSLEEVGVPIDGPWMALFVSLAIFLWFMFTNLISLKFAEVSQWVFTIIQTIPLIILPIIGFIHWGDVADGGSIMVKHIAEDKKVLGLNAETPYLALIAGIGAIAFAYNGFYSASSLRNQMKNPKKLGAAQFIGISIVSLIYLFVSFGFNVAGDGTHEGMTKFMSAKAFKLLRVCIVVGIVAIINNLAMSAPHQMGDLTKSGDAKEVQWIQKLIFRKKYNANAGNQKYVAGWSWIVISALVMFLVLGTIGASFYEADTPNLKGKNLYAFASTVINFTSLFIFSIIVTCILGGLINRKTKKVETEKNKYFIPTAIIAIVINYIGLLYQFIVDFVNVTGYNGAKVNVSIINLSIYFGVLLVSLMPAIISSKKEKKTESKVSLK